jgi:hypothetical protein
MIWGRSRCLRNESSALLNTEIACYTVREMYMFTRRKFSELLSSDIFNAFETFNKNIVAYRPVAKRRLCNSDRFWETAQ